MNKWIILLMLLQTLALQGYSQASGYVNHTELGPLIGKINDSDRRVNFSLQSFNGMRIHPHHSVGFLVGIDTYPGFVLVPLALGWRGVLGSESRISPYASLDIGYGSAVLEKRQKDSFLESWYEGGMMFSPAIGILKKNKKRSRTFSWSVGFKHQKAFFYEGNRIPGLSRDRNNPRLPPGFLSVREESYLLNSLYLKWGMVF